MPKLSKNAAFFSFRSRWRGLTVQLFALIIIPLTALLLTISFGSVLLHQSAMRTLVAERDLRAAQTAARALSEQLYYRAAAVKGLALQAEDGIELQDILSSSSLLLPDFVGGLAAFNRAGEILAIEGDSSFWDNLPNTTQRMLAEAIRTAGEEPFFSAPLVHPDYESPLILVFSAGATGAPVVVGVISPSDLATESIGDVFPVEDMFSAILAGSEYQFLFHQGNSSLFVDSTTRMEILEQREGENGVVFYQDDGQELVLAYSSIPPTGWLFLIEESWASLASPLLRYTEVAPLVLAPVVILALVALWFGARQIITPLQALESRAAALAWGDFEAVEEEVGGIAEIGRLQRTLIHMASKIRSSQKSLRGYIGAITKGQEEERQRLARELHDDTLQSLIALNQKVQLAQMSLSGNVSDPALTEIVDMTEQSIKNLRRITRDLRPPYLEDLGLAAALEMLVQETAKIAGISIRFAREGREERLKPEIELAFYRIAQEGINNILRHAKAEKANIHLFFSADEVRMIISDDGQGFNIPGSPAEFAPLGHYGLLGIHERAELIGAQLNVRAAPGQGTNIVVSFPLEKKEKLIIRLNKTHNPN